MLRILPGLLLLFFLCIIPTYGADYAPVQTKTITGTIVDSDGVPIPGVTIVIDGTTRGTTSSSDGTYSLPDVPGTGALVFSFIGYETQRINHEGMTILDITMLPAYEVLDEVVVTALGIERATKALTYSVSQIDGEELMKAQESNVGSALVGKVAGVDVTSIGGGVAGSNKIVIRGNNSLTGSNNPLFVVDGLPIDNNPRSGWGGRDYGDGLSSINPDDIESISVLKGNSAAALYGYRAANGVVMITTKKGKAGSGIGVEINSSYTFDQAVNTFDSQHGMYGQGLGHQKPTDWAFETHRSFGEKFDGSEAYYPDGTPVTYAAKESHFSEFFRTGHTLQNSVALSGGGSNQSYRLSISDLRNEHIIPNSGQKRNTVALSTNGKYGKRLTVSANVNYSHNDVDNRPTTNSIYSNYVQAMMVMPHNWEIDHFKGPTDKLGAREDGTHYNFSTNDWFTNPYWSAYQYSTNDVSDRVIASGLARFDFTDWLYVQGRVGTDYTSTQITEIIPYGTAHAAPEGLGSVEESVRQISETNMEGMLGAKKEFGDFGVDAFIGASRMRRMYENTGGRGERMSIPFYHVVTNGSVQTAIYDFNQSGVNSTYGSAEVSYKKYIYLTVTGRNDWYSTLNPDNNSKFYYSAGASFLFSDAFDMPTWLNFGKIRLSQAQVGGGGTSPYQTQFSYNINAIGHLGVPLASIPETLANPNLLPYISTETEVGFDVRLLENRIGVDYAYYFRKSEDHIINASYPNSSGYSSGTVNLGEVNNWGHELMLSINPVRGEFNWDIILTGSYNMSEVIEAGETDYVEVGSGSAGTRIRHIEGERYGAILGYKQARTADGTKIWEFNEGRSTWAPLREDDLSILGYGYHPTSLSITNSFTWKNIDFSFMLEGKFGGSFYSETNYLSYLRGNHLNTIGTGIDGIESVNGVDREEGIYLNGEDPDGNEGPFLVENNQFENFYRRLYADRISELNVYDASYLKLRQVVIGYTIPKSTLGKVPISNIRISFVARNLFNLIDHVPNVDPAFAATQTGNDQGMEKYTMLPTRSYGFNLKILF